MTNDRGFTLIEITIVIAFLALLSGYVLEIGYQFYGSQALVAERNSLINLLHRARSLAMNNYNQADHGLYIATTTYVVFQGSSYASRDGDFDEVFQRTAGIELAGQSEMVFSAITGDSNVSGTLSFANGNGGFEISVNNEGRINW